ncbi:MAG: sigma-70 family RNA polymerase sigma factor [Acidobacteriota bacterium]
MTTESPTEAAATTELVRRIAAGDQRAEAELVELYSRGITYLLRHLIGDRQLSEDLHQETFRIALQKLRDSELRDPEKLSGFIRGIARNLSLAARRKTARHALTEDAEMQNESPDPAPSPLREMLRHEERRHIRQVLSELRSARDREVLYRFHIADEPREDICQALGLTSRQFNLVLFRAHQRFRQLLVKTEKRLQLNETGRSLHDADTPGRSTGFSRR